MKKHCIRTSAALVAALAVAALAFPLHAEVSNNAWHATPEPETCAEVGAYSTKAIVIRDAAQLHRVVSNIEQLNFLRGYTDTDAGLSLLLELPDSDESQELAKSATSGEATPPVASPAATAAPAAPAATEAPAAPAGGGKGKR